MKPFKFLQSNKTIRWRTYDGFTHRLDNMSVDHMVSIVRCMNGSGNMIIPNPYEGRTHTEWINIFHNEMERRRDENI